MSVIGGCCGTTPEHLAAVVRALRRRSRRRRAHPVHEPAAASIYTQVPFEQDTSFLVVGERTNANGSKKFREAMLDGRLGHLRGHGPRPGQGGLPPHRRVRRLHRRRRRGRHDRGGQPLRHPVERAAHGRLHRGARWCETALEWIGGRPVLNSVNLEEGDAPGTRLDTFLTLAREFGAAVVCTCIDEEGQARTAEWKVRAATRHPRHRRRALRARRPRTCSSTPWPCRCPPAWRRAAEDGIETIEGIRRIKAELPGVSTILGPVQRVLRPQPGRPPGAQLGVPPRVRGGRPRRGHRARLQDPAAVPASTTGPREVCLDLIYDRRTDGYDPLQELLALFEGRQGHRRRGRRTALDWPVDRRLSQRIIDGDRNGLEDDLDRGARAAGTRAARHRQRHPARRA